MAVVNLKIGGRDYQVACDDGQEEHLRYLADDIDDRVRSLVYRMGANPGEAMSLLLASLTLVDELVEAKKENGAASAQQEHEARIMEMESAMAETLEDIAIRIEKITDQIE